MRSEVQILSPRPFLPVRRAGPGGGSDRRDAFASRAILGRVTDPLATDETRIDRWLCAVRLVKTRPLATRLCEGGHVLVNGSPAKPSTKVRAGDRVEALIADRERIVEVVRPIESRVGAAVAATCYVDHSPPVVREAGAGDHARARGGPAEQAPAARVGAPAPGRRHLSRSPTAAPRRDREPASLRVRERKARRPLVVADFRRLHPASDQAPHAPPRVRRPGRRSTASRGRGRPGCPASSPAAPARTRTAGRRTRPARS